MGLLVPLAPLGLLPGLPVLRGLAQGTTTYYVNLANPAPEFPYTSWATAATNIQDALDAAAAGDEVVVTNGVYAVGGRAVDGVMTNRVVISRPVRLRSVNGSDVTTILGSKATEGGNGDGAIRCVYLVEGASLSGFTLSGGATRTSGNTEREQQGGGVWCATTNAVVRDCVLTGNSAVLGGGASGGTFERCTLSSNTAGDGAGAYGSLLVNCRITGNEADFLGGGALSSTVRNSALTGNVAHRTGGGAQFSTLYNCTVTDNSGPAVASCTLFNCIVYLNRDGNWSDSTFESSCTTPLPAGPGNLADDPLLATATHISATSPCRNAGNPAYASGTDLDGEPWDAFPSIGADQLVPGNSSGPLTMRISASSTAAQNFFPIRFTADNTGPILASVWDFGDGTVVTNQPFVEHRWTDSGTWTVRLTGYNDANPAGVTATVEIVVSEAFHYVSLASTAPLFPYTSWETAATNIQDALDASGTTGFTVLVTNGVYRSGTALASGLNRVAVTNVTLRSVNGPDVTVIDGQGTERGAFLSANAKLSGFTVRNGAAGGVLAGASSVVTNCVVTANTGDGVSGGTVYQSLLSSNTASGATSAVLYNCTLRDNAGAGAVGATLHNSLLQRNRAGGATQSTLYNCTVTDNPGGGVFGGRGYNSVVYFNGGANWGASAAFEYSCTTPLPPGPGNIASDPRLASATHLSTASPCLGAGSPAYAQGVDTDGEAWANPPAMGADEVHSGQSLGPLAMQVVPPTLTPLGVGAALDLAAYNTGSILSSVWDLADGTVVTNQAFVRHAWTLPGTYTVRLTGYNDSNPDGVSTTVDVQVVEEVHYVNAANPRPLFPYMSWATAATNIQQAVLAGTAPGYTVLVTNGLYQSTGIALTNAVLRSVNGPDHTIIDGGGRNQCVRLVGGSLLSGFTVRLGSAQEGAGVGGITAGGQTPVVTNCVLSSNLALGDGGGAHGAILQNCMLLGNLAFGYGGGAYRSVLYNCTIRDSFTFKSGGAISGGTAYNSTLVANSAFERGGGAHGGTLFNCIVYFNNAASGSNWIADPSNPDNPGRIEFSCTAPLPPTGTGNIATDPGLVDVPQADYRLRSDSPCIDAGTDLSALLTGDLAGVVRPQDGNGDGVARFDMGAYEFVPSQPPPPATVTLRRSASGLELVVTGQPGSLIRVEQSSTLQAWETVTTFTMPASGEGVLAVPDTTRPALFFRAVTLP